MPDTEFAVHVVGDVPVVTTPEEIDITNASGLRSALLRAAARSRAPVVVDMSRTQFCDLSGPRSLLRAQKQAQDRDSNMLVVISTPAVLRIFAISGLDSVISVFSSLEPALAEASATRPAGTSTGLTARVPEAVLSS